MKLTKVGIKQLFSNLQNKTIADGMMRDLIDTLWREMYWLFKEGHLYDPDLKELTPEELEILFPELVYTRNKIGDTTNFSVLIGHGHESNGDLSVILGGIGNISNDYKEIIMGGYATQGSGNQKEWEDIDRLIVVGNGEDADNRNDTLIIYKDGYTVFENAVKIGDYTHGELDPVEGTFRHTVQTGPEVWWIDRWVPLTGEYYGGWDLHVNGSNKGTIENGESINFQQGLDISLKYTGSGTGSAENEIELAYGEKIITQANHGFTSQHPIKENGTEWVKSQGDEVANANTMAFVKEIIDENTFILKRGGVMAGNYVKGEEYFLDPAPSGLPITLSDPEVWNIGEVRQSLGWSEEDGFITIEISVGMEICESPFENNIVESLFIADDVLTLTQSLGEDITCPFPYYTKTELNTSGAGGQVHWDNITNKPSFPNDNDIDYISAISYANNTLTLTGIGNAFNNTVDLTHTHDYSPSNHTHNSEMSITGDGSTGSKFKLSGDLDSPGNSKYYGTNSSGTKGYFDLPSGSTSPWTRNTSGTIPIIYPTTISDKVLIGTTTPLNDSTGQILDVVGGIYFNTTGKSFTIKLAASNWIKYFVAGTATAIATGSDGLSYGAGIYWPGGDRTSIRRYLSLTQQMVPTIIDEGELLLYRNQSGDLICMIKEGGVTKTTTLVDFSAL